MRLVTFTSPGQPSGPGRVGVLAEGMVVDIFATQYAMARHRGDSPPDAHRAASAAAPADMVAFFAAGDMGRRAADSAVEFALGAGHGIAGPAGEPAAPPERDVRLLAPVPRPRRVRDYLTYEAHAAGAGLELPEAFTRMPICYKCNVETIIGPGDTAVWPAYSDQLDFELEIGFFTGRGGRNISLDRKSVV